MLAISKMKSLILSSLSPSPLPLPKTQPLPFFSMASSSFLCNPESFRFSSSITGKALIGFRKSPSSAISFRAIRSDASPSASGEIHVIVGPMFAGKTTSLIRRVQTERSNGRNVAIIKSNKDNRYGLDSIVTHDGEKLPCLALANLLSYQERIGAYAYGQLHVIGIDEAQFFEDLYDFCRQAADQDGKMVIVAGLDGDYLRRSFGSVLDIIPLADSVTKLTSRCELCGKRAFFTLRKTDETRTELIGGAEVYMPVCRHHYVSGQGVVEAARGFLESQNVHQCSL